MNQSENPDEFFKKFGFNLTTTKKHHEFADEQIKFTGLEASYVAKLEHEVEHLHKYIRELRDRLDWLQNKEFRSFLRSEPK